MSRRLAILNFSLRRFARPLLKRTKTPERARRDFNLAARLFFRGPVRDAAAGSSGGVPVLDVIPQGAQPDAALLYFHGGGYITGRPETHLPMLGHLARRCDMRVVLPRYRLAPEAPFPAAFEDAVAAWDGLRRQGLLPEDILLGGDSAGGGLALAVLAKVLGRGERPAGLFALSPWTDFTLAGASLSENAERDPILPVERITELRDLVAPGADLTDPRLSPLFADFTGAPPVYLQVSETEILRDDTTRLLARMQDAGVDARADVWPDAPHVWQLFRGWLPEADDALAEVATFAEDCLRPSRPRSES